MYTIKTKETVVIRRYFADQLKTEQEPHNHLAYQISKVISNSAEVDISLLHQTLNE